MKENKNENAENKKGFLNEKETAELLRERTIAGCSFPACKNEIELTEEEIKTLASGLTLEPESIGQLVEEMQVNETDILCAILQELTDNGEEERYKALSEMEKALYITFAAFKRGYMTALYEYGQCIKKTLEEMGVCNE